MVSQLRTGALALWMEYPAQSHKDKGDLEQVEGGIVVEKQNDSSITCQVPSLF